MNYHLGKQYRKVKSGECYIKKQCRRCNKIISEAKSGTKYCHECAKIVSIENARKAGRKYYNRRHDTHKCNKCGEPIQPRKHLCEICKKKETTYKQLQEKISKLEYQLALYEKMFKAQDDMIIENNDKIKELKEDNNRLRQYIDKMQKDVILRTEIIRRAKEINNDYERSKSSSQTKFNR